jgi:hypothetical protein
MTFGDSLALLTATGGLVTIPPTARFRLLGQPSFPSRQSEVEGRSRTPGARS